ncbi:MAG: hypothetical protein QY304_01685 [Candidatus Paceibacterota bacterium]|nr:MAG: hypothetical protein QY304_01685 [Candidatus Paceibacterota bacterium]
MESVVWWLDLIGKLTLVIITFLLPLWFILLARWLAKIGEQIPYLQFFTVVNEGEAKTITVNGKFDRAIMSFTGYAFRWQVFSREEEIDFTPDELRWAKERLTEENSTFSSQPKRQQESLSRDWLKREAVGEPGPWDVIRLSENLEIRRGQLILLSSLPFIGKLVGGLRWVGILPGISHRVYQMPRFAWASVEYRKDEQGNPTHDRVVVPKEMSSYEVVFVKRDVYPVILRPAIVDEGVQINLVVLLQICSRNPFKTMHRIEHWFESVSNRVQTRLRELVGRRGLKEVYGSGPQPLLAEALLRELQDIITDVRIRFGIQIDAIEIFSAEFARNTDNDIYILPFKSEQEAQGIKIIAKAREEEARLVLRATEQYGGREAVETRLLTGPDSKVTTVVQKGAINVALPPSSPPTPPATGGGTGT